MDEESDDATPVEMAWSLEREALDAMCSRSLVRLVDTGVVGQIMDLYVSVRDGKCRRIAVLNPTDGRVHHLDLVPGIVEYQ